VSVLPGLERLHKYSMHACAHCLRVVEFARILGRDSGGTRMIARCHRRVMEAVVPDVLVEDGKRFFWFDGVEGAEYLTPRERERAKLSAELEQQRAQRRAQEEG